MVGYLSPGPARAVNARGRPNVAAKNRVSHRQSAGREGRRGAVAQRTRPREQALDRGREDADVTRTRPQHKILSWTLDSQRAPGGQGRVGGTEFSPLRGRGK